MHPISLEEGASIKLSGDKMKYSHLINLQDHNQVIDQWETQRLICIKAKTQTM